jgi:T5SS/PEP-CTERM-associated repeat protein
LPRTHVWTFVLATLLFLRLVTAYGDIALISVEDTDVYANGGILDEKNGTPCVNCPPLNLDAGSESSGTDLFGNPVSASAHSKVTGVQITVDPSGVVQITGSGTVDAKQTRASAIAHATIIGNLKFRLTGNSYNCTVTGSESASNSVNQEITCAFGFGQLNGTSVNIDETLVTGSKPLSFSGTLPPGDYNLWTTLSAGVTANSEGSGTDSEISGSMNFQITLTPVALPTPTPTPTPTPEIRWNNANGGLFGTASNWDPQRVPGVNDNVVFDLLGSYNIDLSQNVTNKKVRANGAGVNVTLSLNGFTYVTDQFTTGGLSGDNGSLTLTGSTANVPATLAAGSFAAQTAPPPGQGGTHESALLAVRNGFPTTITGRVLEQTPSAVINGELRVTSLGTQVDADAMSVASHAGDVGTLLVSDQAAVDNKFATVGEDAGDLQTAPATGGVGISDSGSWSISDLLTIGKSGVGRVNITTDGQLYSGSFCLLGDEAGSSGVITVDGAGSQLLLNDVTIVGYGGSGTIKLTNVASATVGTLQVGYQPGSAGEVRAEEASVLTADNLFIGGQGSGALVLNEGGVAVSQNVLIGLANGGSGHVTLGSDSVLRVQQKLIAGGAGSGSLEIARGIVTIGEASAGSAYGKVLVGPGGILAGNGTIIAREIVLSGGTNVFNGAQIQPGNSPGTLTLQGDFTQELNSKLVMEVAGLNDGEFDVLHVTGDATLGGTLELVFLNGYLPKTGDVLPLLQIDGNISGSFSEITFPQLLPGFQVSTEFVNGVYKLTALNDAVLAPTSLLNISTRLRVGTGDNVLIGGFIITGNQPKRVMVRAIGPSLSTAGVSDALADPTLELHDATGALIGQNDNWQNTQVGGVITQNQVAEIQASTIPPNAVAESAIIATLDPGAYTAIVAGVNNTSGVGLVEVYDLSAATPAKLANISTRGFVGTGDNVMIGGFIVGNQTIKVLMRGIGPSLASAGISNALQDPTLELHDGNGTLIGLNDNWKDSQRSEIEATTIPPSDDREAAILATLTPGPYTAILRGVNNSTGVALVEAFNVP